MAINWLKENKALSISMLTILLFLAAGYALYALFGHQLIRAIYEGRSIEILNKIIEGQSSYPLKYYYQEADNIFFVIFVSIPILLIIFSLILKPKFAMAWPPGKKWLEKHTDIIDAIPDSHIGLWIALAAGLSLYAELMIIRLHSSYFQLFAYFKNVSLLSCFLGLGIGYARGAKRPLTTPLVLPFLALQIIFMSIHRFSPLASYLQNPISEQFTFGLSQTRDIIHILVVYGFLIVIFAFNALCFVPLGHLASRLMMRRQKLVSYGWNLIGSLAGILLFSFISFIWAPPSIWIILAAIALMVFFRKDIISFFSSVLAVIIVLIFLAIPFRLDQFDVYSPYQILTLNLSENQPLYLKTSNAYYQKILNLSDENVRDNEKLKKAFLHYSLPYYFKPEPKRVLIVGSGTGNDVAAAIRNDAHEIDAVEIDPAILQFGKQLHPELPYHFSNVNAIVDDARAFIRHTDKRYDLIVYGLLDSHTLLSGRSGGIRLDSYVYTVEAFREARERLTDDGIISLTFSLISPELGRKLFLMLQEAFDGLKPTVYQTDYDGGYTFLAGNRLKGRIPYQHPALREITAEFDDSKIQADKSTDDWPFFYMPVRKYPASYIVMILALLAISIAFIRRLVSGSGSRFSIPCFFLGAGFMLVETKGITELALVYGSTWIVIGIVITFILIMAFLANLLVMRMGRISPLITYGLLFVSLSAGLGLTFINLGSFAPWLNRIIIPIMLTLPLFFSGFAFSTELRKSSSVAVALSSNLLGAMLGGFLEYNSMYFGFRSLYFFALVMYGFAFLGSMRTK
jgi:predicted membrane-bound spermidine synthase